MDFTDGTMIDILKTRRIELTQEMEKAAARIAEIQSGMAEMAALSERIKGAIALIDELLQKQQG